MGIKRNFIFLPCLFISLSFITLHCHSVNFIISTQYIKDSQTIVSSQKNFRLGFFSPRNSTNRYVGIWYDKVSEQTTVWVANRNNPINDSSSVFKIANDGNLVVLNGQGNVLWATDVASSTSNSSIAELSDSGNLVLRETFGDGRILWQSFEHPSDTFLPTMKLGFNAKTGEKQVITSWKDSNSDPSTGSFSAELHPSNIPEVIIRRLSDNQLYWRSGPWNNRIFIGVPTMYSVYLTGFSLVKDEQEGRTYLTLGDANKPDLVRLTLESDGLFAQKSWTGTNKEWVDNWHSKLSDCDIYGKCGPFGSCDALDSPICSCLRGFKPKFENEWSKGNWSSGCVRKAELMCERMNKTNIPNEADGFLKLENMKVPDFVNWWRAENMEDCQKMCLNNCSCKAYSFDSNIGCMWWNGNLSDIQKFSNFSQSGAELHLRVAFSELDADEKKDLKKVTIITFSIGVVVTLILFTYFSWRWIHRQREKGKKGIKLSLFGGDDSNGNESDPNILGANPELKIFDIETLAIATNNFTGANKLGHGGFGSVYKGILFDGKEIAVKRLSKSSGQGLEEFKNEVVVISKLQHRNLVRLLGCCYEGEEKMLIYEFMPNKSLDAFLFDPTKRAMLDWKKRIQIIEGISRGILYLHRDSRLKVIHRDLKPSNILLDAGLIPKISDFGMARIFGGDELHADTKRVVGTYGYMAPEYAMEGRFSEKSDVFSFGVLLLEIVSGKRSTSFYHDEPPLSLLGYVWKMWNENKMQSLIDPTLSPELVFKSEMLRCIHVGLLCVQEYVVDRPTMSTTLSMLTSEITTLPNPKQPAFTQIPTVSPNSIKYSINNVTVTTIEGR